jgi:hypothetical protein
MEIGILGGTLLCVIMASMVFIGLHLNKPFPWERDRNIFDKSDIKYRDGDNT